MVTNIKETLWVWGILTKFILELKNIRDIIEKKIIFSVFFWEIFISKKKYHSVYFYSFFLKKSHINIDLN
jgi:hypothetical protein